jgi:outer membrane protein assembly factor BamB
MAPWIARTATVAIGLTLALSVTGTVTAAPRPTVLWQQALAGWGQPAANASTAFVLTRQHELVALDLVSGVERWRAYTGGPGDAPLGSSIRLSGAYVIVGDDAIVAFDAATGRPAWRFVPVEGQGAGIFLGEASAGVVLAGSTSGDLYAIDAGTGALRWTRRMTATGGAAVYPPIVAGGRIVAAFTRFDGRLAGGVAAFAMDGTPLWTRALPAGTGATGPVVMDRTTAIVATTDGTIRAFSIVDGAPRWVLPPIRGAGPDTGGRDIRALATSGRVLVAGSLSGALVAYDLDTRRQRWRYDDGPESAAALRLVADGTHVYAPYTDGSLVAVSVATGCERWRTEPMANALEWPPSVAGRRIVAAGSTAVVALAAQEAR